MTNGNTIKFQGKTYNLDDIRAGIQKKDFESTGNSVLLSLFDSLDKQDKYGFKNKTLDINETKELIQNLIKVAGDDKLSKREAEKYLASLGIKDVKVADLMQFLDFVIKKSNDIKETTYNQKRNSTIIEYKEGYYDEVLYDGRHAVKAKESKDTSLESSFELNVPFTKMADGDGNLIVNDKQNEHDYRIDIEEIISKNNLDKSKAKISYDNKFNPPIMNGITYYDDDGNEVLKVSYKESQFNNLSKYYVNDDGKTIISSIEYKQEDNWTKLGIFRGQYLTSISTLNNDRSVVLSKTVFDNKNQTRIAQYTYNPETNRSTEIEYDYISGRQKTLKELDEKGRVVKVKHYDNNEEIENTEINEYIGNSQEPFKTKKFDKNNQIVDFNNNSNKDNISALDILIYGENYNLLKILEKDINDLAARELLNATIENIKNTKLKLNGELLSFFGDKYKVDIKNFILQMLDKCKTSMDFYEIKKTLKLCEISPNNALLRNKYLYPILNQLYNNQPDGTLDQVNYQGFVGDCWLLSATSSISEVPEGGQEYINSLFKKDKNGKIVDEDGNVTVILNNEKNNYVIYRQEREIENTPFSLGEPNMRVLEIAFDKYAKENTLNEKKYLDGGKSQYAFEVYSGNKTIYAERKCDKLGVTVDGKFIEISPENADKIANIPIVINDITIKDIQNLAKLKKRMAFCCDSENYGGGHAYYVKNIRENSIEVKEPSNTENVSTYSHEGFLATYENATIFILPKNINSQ